MLIIGTPKPLNTNTKRTCLGIKCIDGIVLAHEKLILNKLLVPKSNNRIQTVDNHIGFVAAGLLADSRHLAGRAKDEADSYKSTYHVPIPTKVLSSSLIDSLL